MTRPPSYTRDRAGRIYRDGLEIDRYTVHVVVSADGSWRVDGRTVPLVDPARQPRLARWIAAGYGKP